MVKKYIMLKQNPASLLKETRCTSKVALRTPKVALRTPKVVLGRFIGAIRTNKRIVANS